MSKKLLAVAIAAVLVPAAAMAEESNVTVYGRIDYGFMSRGGDGGGASQVGKHGRQNDFEDGINGGNRLGFKGTEDLGNGLKAIFEIEFGFSGDTGESFGKTSNRHSWVGLTGNFGTVLGGRLDGARYSFVGQYDPFKNQTVANAGSLFGVTSGLGQADRADNAIIYITPEVAPGLKFLAAYTSNLLQETGKNTTAFGQASTNIDSGDTPLWAVAAMYNNGPVSLTLDYENLKIKKGRGALGGVYAGSHEDLEFDIWVTGASYDFGVAKVSAYYENVEGADRASRTASKSDGWLLGVSAPVTTNVTLKASYVQANSDVVADCSKWGIGAEYAFSKRTNLYATYAKIDNDKGGTCAISKSAAGDGHIDTASGAASTGSGGKGYGEDGINIGIAHTF